MTRVFSNLLKQDSKEVLLAPSEVHHLLHVLRTEDKETVQVFNGQGVRADGIVNIIKKNHVSIEILSSSFRENPWNIGVAFGIAKSAAMEFEIKRATELGVKALIPLKTQHSLKVDSWNDERWQNLMIETCKQCQNDWLPTLSAPQTLEQFANSYHGQLLLCDENRREASTLVLGQNPCLIVGAEGGFSDAERALLQQKNVQTLGLGPNRLRTEIATIVGIILLKQKNGELSPP